MEINMNKHNQKQKIIVMKFGGSSVGTGYRMVHVAEIIKRYSEENKVVVIVSAIQGVTDKLISIFQKYQAGNYIEAKNELQNLYKIHMFSLKDLKLKKGEYLRVEKSLMNLFGQVSFYLVLQNNYSEVGYDYVISFGERFSSCLLAATLNSVNVRAKAVDSASVIIANDIFSNAKVLIPETKQKVKKFLIPLLSKNILPVVSGFFGSTKNGQVITLGRGGSDYSATILANVIDAKEVILWKEVDGVFNGDPKKDEKAMFYPELSYDEALVLARNGAKVLHPEAMKPVASKDIIVWVKNTFKPEFEGTKIWRRGLCKT